MSGLVFSDLHAWPYRSHKKMLENGLNSRFWNAIKVLDQIYDLVVEYHCSWCVFDGDITRDGTIDADMIDPLKLRILRIGKKCHFFLVTGNHDLGTSGKSTVLSAFYGKGIQVIYPTIPYYLHDEEGLKLAFLPYSQQYDPSKTLKFLFRVHSIDKNWLFFYHYGLGDVAFRGIYIKSPLKLSDLPKRAGFNFLGHIHEYQRLNENTLYVGASQHVDESDFGRGNYCFIYNRGEVFRIPLRGHKFVKIPNSHVKNNFVYFDMNNLSSEKVEKLRKYYLERGAFDVTPIPGKVGARVEVIKRKISEYDIIKRVADSIDVRVNKNRLKNVGLGILGKVLG